MLVNCSQCKCPCNDDTRRKFNFDGCNCFISFTNPIYDNMRAAIQEKDDMINKLTAIKPIALTTNIQLAD